LSRREVITCGEMWARGGEKSGLGDDRETRCPRVGATWHAGRGQFSAYRPVLALPAARAALLLGFFIRIPLFAAGVILTLHVVRGTRPSCQPAGRPANA